MQNERPEGPQYKRQVPPIYRAPKGMLVKLSQALPSFAKILAFFRLF
jgi:hypothetical protein